MHLIKIINCPVQLISCHLPSLMDLLTFNLQVHLFFLYLRNAVFKPRTQNIFKQVWKGKEMGSKENVPLLTNVFFPGQGNI